MAREAYPGSGGTQYTYEYADGLFLERVTYPDGDDDGTSRSRANNLYREYLYAEPAHLHDPDFGPLWYPGALTGIQGRDHPRFAIYEYDEAGRAWSSAHTGDANAVTLEYLTAPSDNGVPDDFIVNRARPGSRTRWDTRSRRPTRSSTARRSRLR